MKKLMCLIFGHRWRVVSYRTLYPYRICVRCNKIEERKAWKKNT